MSAPPAVDCEGAPRDLGLDQGRFARHQIAQNLRGQTRAGWLDRMMPDPHEPEVRIGRDLYRYFPHMAERTVGLSKGARVTERDLWSLLRDVIAAESGSILAAPGAVVRSVDAQPADLIVRRSAPGEDFRSIEVAWPGLVPALVGVNEHGLVVAASWALRPGQDKSEPCRAPGLLLVQDCLQRFDGVEAAVEWCERRPAGGDTTVVIADRSGAQLAVHVTPKLRQVVEPRDDLIIAPFATEKAETLRKAIASAPSRDAASLSQALERDAGRSVLTIQMVPGEPRLGLSAPGSEEVQWLTL